MNVRTKILAFILLLGMLPAVAIAQDDLPDLPAGWDIGIETEQDTAPTFELSQEGEVQIKFWIDNRNLGSLNLDIEYDLPFDATESGPDSVEVPSQTNKSFEFTVQGVDVSSFAAGQSDLFTVRGTVTGYNGLPLTTGGDSKEGEGNLTIPMVVDLTIELSEPSGPFNAGTTSSLTAIVTNTGNAADSVYKISVTDSCPLLDVGGAEEMEGIAIEMGQNLTQLLNLSTSNSHPSKNCVIEISIQSKGDFDAGRSQTADSAEVTIQIVEDRGDNDENNGDGDSDTPDDSTNGDSDVISQNWTPNWPAASIIAFLWAAIYLRRF